MAVGSSPTRAGSSVVAMKWAAVTWSSPLQPGVLETSPSPTIPSSVWILTTRKGEVVWLPRAPRVARLARSGR